MKWFPSSHVQAPVADRRSGKQAEVDREGPEEGGKGHWNLLPTPLSHFPVLPPGLHGITVAPHPTPSAKPPKQWWDNEEKSSILSHFGSSTGLPWALSSWKPSSCCPADYFSLHLGLFQKGEHPDPLGYASCPSSWTPTAPAAPFIRKP